MRPWPWLAGLACAALLAAGCSSAGAPGRTGISGLAALTPSAAVSCTLT